MQANFDARTGAAGGLTASLERKQPEARKDRWMLELERAAMAEGAASMASRGAPAVQAPAGAHATAAPAAAAGQAAAAPAAPARGQATARQDLGAGQSPQAQRGAPARRDAPDGAARRASGVHGAAATAQMSGAGAFLSAAAPAGETPAAPAGWGAALAAGGAALSPSLPPSLSPSLQVAPAAAALLSRPPAAGLQLALGSGAPPSPEGAMADPTSGQEAAATDAPALPEGEEYARSLLHVFHAEDGVHAFLRDASLNGEQVRRVASAMAGELALAGTPLSALTVNGRRILSSGAAGDQSGRRAAGYPGEALAAPLTPVAFKGA